MMPGRGSIWRCAAPGPLFGSAAARERAARDCRDILRMPRDAPKVTDDAIKMRAEMERHKPPQSKLDVKLGPGGLVDLEFAVHVLQLTRHVGLDPRLEVAIDAARGRELDSGKHCRSAKVAHAHVGDDAPRRARRGQADRGDLAAGRRGVRRRRAGTRCLPSMTPPGNALRELWTTSKARDEMINEGDKAPAIRATASDGSSGRPRLPGRAARALFLSQGRHVGLHARGAGFHRACAAISTRPA